MTPQPPAPAGAPDTAGRSALPERYNAAEDLLSRHRGLAGGKTAYIDDCVDGGGDSGGRLLTYEALDRRCHGFAGALLARGVRAEERVLICAFDTIDFPVAFLGCLLAGVIPVPVNTMLTVDDYAYMLRHSGARAVIVSASLAPALRDAAARAAECMTDAAEDSARPISRRTGQVPLWILADPGAPEADEVPADTVAALADEGPALAGAVDTGPDSVAFWLYSSGSTGRPKGTVHTHGNLFHTADLYARQVLGLREDDVVFSAAKLFFAYGLGNALTFPLAAGATTVLMAGRPTPQAVFARLTAHRPTVFCGVPTLYAAMLADPDMPARESLALRVCTSAGEALPRDIGERFRAHAGCDILDGIGSTEMLHIFLSNRPGDVRYGTTGKAVPGYTLRLLDEGGQPCAPGEIGDLYISGPSAALMYWGNREKSRDTFVGAWTRSGDKYSQDAEGYYVYAGRSDDMLKVGGVYVSPFEVEAALARHPAIMEAAVIGVEDAQRLVKPKAFVVLRPGRAWHAAMEAELQAFVKSLLAPYKYPRSIECIEELPKTATGKIQRFRLRQREGSRAAD